MNKFVILLTLAVLFTAGCSFTGNYTRVTDAATLKNYVGEKVVVTGNISKIIWQHMMGNFEGYPYDYYFDIGDSQIVIYSRKPIGSNEQIRVYGEVVKISGKAKGDPREEYSEYHILVDRWEEM
jgi:hypothetical protein